MTETPDRDGARLESLEGLRRLAGAGVVGILLMDLHGRVLDANGQLLEMLGYTHEDVRAGNLRWDDITPPEWRGVDESITTALLDAGEAKPVEKEYYHRDGRRVPVLVGGALLSRETTQTIAFVVDLTRQRHAEAGVRLRSDLLDLSYDAILVWGLGINGAEPIQVWNCGAETLYGYTKDEAVGRISHQLLHTWPSDGNIADIERALRENGEWSGELNHRTRAGEHIVVDARLQVLRPLGNPPVVFETNRDVSARKRAEARAYEANAWLASVVEGSEDAIISKALDGTITSWNSAAERLLGYSADEMVGRSILTIIPPERHHEETEIQAQLARGERINQVETIRVRKDGTRFPAMLTISPVSDSAGRLIGVSKILRDITDQRIARQHIEEARHTAESASRAKSNFIASMSHELRTPLNAIMGYSDLLDLGVAGALGDEQRRYVQRTRDAARALLTIVDDILDLARMEAGKTSTAENVGFVREAITDALSFVEPQASAKRVTLVDACAADVAFTGDAARVRQIVTNLVANAVKFTAAGGRVTITCGHSEAGPDEVGPPRDIVGGAKPWTVIRVQDTGIGIPPSAIERIFEPFEQAESGLRRSQPGAGLGLAISRQLARLMGGDVAVRSIPGEGSTFLVYLPAASPQAAAGREQDRRDTSRYARGLGIISDVALEEIEHILRAYEARLRTDPATPSAGRASHAELGDHGAAFVADLTHTLLLIEAAAGQASPMLRDGEAIQREIAERHGALRARMGWAASEMRREFAILREEIESATRRRAAELARNRSHEPDFVPPVDEAVGILGRFMQRAEHVSLGAYARAQQAR